MTAATWNQDVVDNIKYLKGQAGVIEFENSIRAGATGARIDWLGTAYLPVVNASASAFIPVRALEEANANALTPTKIFVNGQAGGTDYSTTNAAFQDVTNGSVTLTPPIAGIIIAVAQGHMVKAASGEGEARIQIDGQNGIEVSSVNGGGSLVHRASVSAGARVVKMQLRSVNGVDSVALNDTFLVAYFFPYTGAS